jgi:uncharacterized phiE125 gp8 family phage protein
LSIGPTIEPVTEAELVGHLQYGEGGIPDDQLGTARVLLSAARQWVENRLQRQLITATWIAYLERFEPSFQIAAKLPIIAVSSIQYYDVANTLQTVAASVYQVDAISPNRPARICTVSGQSWPLTYDRMNAVQVTFTAGYGATREHVPLGIRHAILMVAADWWVNREETVIGTINSKIANGVDMVLQPFEWGFYA